MRTSLSILPVVVAVLLTSCTFFRSTEEIAPSPDAEGDVAVDASNGGKDASAGDMGSVDAGPDVADDATDGWDASDASDTGPDADTPLTIENPCEAIPPADVSTPDIIIGDGTPASCTEDALDSALGDGGTIVFDCGPDPVTIELTTPIFIRDSVVLDGGGLVTLSGGNLVPIFFISNASPIVVYLQRLSLVDGRFPAANDGECGAAIVTDEVDLTIVQSEFSGHSCPTSEPSGGGAIYADSMERLRLSDVVFHSNRAGSGGAIFTVGTDTEIVNSEFRDNEASIDSGGALYHGGQHLDICGVRFVGNTAEQSAGALAVSAPSLPNAADIAWTEFRGNSSNLDGGAIQVSGGRLNVEETSFVENESSMGGAVSGSDARLELVNSTFARNLASQQGGAFSLANVEGTIEHVTLVENEATLEAGVLFEAAATSLTLKNSVLLDNGAVDSQNSVCSVTLDDRNGNMQWPPGEPCTDDISFEDPLLDELQPIDGATSVAFPADQSPAIGHASDCAVTDQLGRSRPADDCAAGAVEPL